MRKAFSVLGTILTVFGAMLLLAVGTLYAYGTVERLRFEREYALTPIGGTPAAMPEIAVPTSTPAPEVLTAVASPAATATPSPTSTPLPALPAKRIRIPKIELDSPVVESPIVDGQWQVPKFAAGHLAGTGTPGQPGNVVLSGHVESISSGNVFANLDQLENGDQVTLLTDASELQYVVTETRVVKNDDLSVVAPTPNETLTLITCTGTWLPLARDYDSRLIIIAERVSTSLATPAASPTTE